MNEDTNKWTNKERGILNISSDTIFHYIGGKITILASKKPVSNY